MAVNHLSPVEVKNILEYTFKNNIRLAKEGKKPVAIEVEGNAGIGKTSIISQTAKDTDCNFVRLNLAEITLEDLVGYPTKEYAMSNAEEEEVWVLEKSVDDFLNKGYNHVNNSRMSYARPMWIVGKEDKPVILLLDDYSRATGNLMQATMTLIDEGGYVSWRLPEGSTVVLSTNPDNGDFLVTSMDEAQKTRYLGLKMRFDVDNWAEYAEKYGLDGRCINFILKHPEVVQGTKDREKDDKGNTLIKANIRLWTKYFDALSGIEDFEEPDSFSLLMNLGTCLPNEHMILFSQFIKQKLDKLPTPQAIISHKDEKRLKSDLQEIVGKGTGKSFRADLASIICKRIVNFCMYNEDFFRDAKEGKARIARVGDVLFKWELFGKDLIQLAARKIVKMNYMKSLMAMPEFINYFK